MSGECGPILEGSIQGLRVHEAVLDPDGRMLFRESGPEGNRTLADFESGE